MVKLFVNPKILIQVFLKRLIKKRLSTSFNTKREERNPNAQLINRLAQELSISGNYLEIGIEYGYTFEGVKFKRKVGIDPNPLFYNFNSPLSTRVIKVTSDSFFHSADKSEKFSFIFIDGLHIFDQVLKDFSNSLRHLEIGGMILIDDTIPSDKFSAMPSFEACQKFREIRTGIKSSVWHGDVFKLIYLISSELREYLEWFTLGDAWNPKTIVRLRNDNLNREVLIQIMCNAKLEKYRNIDFEKSFLRGIPPKFFNVVTTSQAIELLKAHVN